LFLFFRLSHDTNAGSWNPLLHLDSTRGWNVVAHLPFLSFFFQAFVLRYGFWAACQRWFVVLFALLAFVLGATSKHGSTPSDEEGMDTSIVAEVLHGACGGEVRNQAFVDPVSGFLLVRQTSMRR
jgi:hypothetical protein